MSATPSRQAVFVGLFVAVGTLILAGGIFMIGRINDSFSAKITATTVFDEVAGLQKGDNIWFSGVKVGTVQSLEFTPDSKVRVALDIDEELAPFIHADAVAKIGSDGLIGNRIVVLAGGTDASPPLFDGAEIAASKDVSTEEILETLQKNNANLVAITTDLKAITATLAAGEGSLGHVIKDDTLARSLERTAATLETTSARADTLTSNLNAFSAQLNKPGTLPQQILTDETTWVKVKEAVEDAKAASARAHAMVDGLAADAERADTALGTLTQDPEAGRDLKAALDNLDRSTALLTEDLEALQHTWPFRRGLKKLAKAEAEAAEEGEADPDSAR